MQTGKRLLLGCLSIALGFAGGCTKRVNLSAAKFEELRTLDPEFNVLRVYTSRKLITAYPELQELREISLKREKIKIRGARRPHEEIIGRNAPGRVLKVEERNEMPLLWVTFFDTCDDPSCAYGFVLTEQGKYSLVSIPALKQYDVPIAYRGCRGKRHKMTPGKLKSVGELNPVFVVSRRRGKKMLPVNLQLREDTFKPTRKTRRRAGGV